MLRLLLVILLLANLGYFAWTQGWLGSAAPEAAQAAARPEVQAERINVLERHPIALTAPAAATGSTIDATIAGTAPSSTPEAPGNICIEAGPFDEAEFAQVSTAVRTLRPDLVWETLTRASPEQWSVYMGPFDNEAALERKQAELDQMPRLRYEVLRTPASLAPGLSLGRYDSEAAANAALERLKQTGVRTAKVVQLRRAIERQLLRVNQADSATQVALSGLSLPRGQTFTACRF